MLLPHPPFPKMMAGLLVGLICLFLALTVEADAILGRAEAQEPNSHSDDHNILARQVPPKTEIGVCHTNYNCSSYGKGVAGVLSGSSDLPAGGCQSFKSAYDGTKWCSGVGE